MIRDPPVPLRKGPPALCLQLEDGGAVGVGGGVSSGRLAHLYSTKAHPPMHTTISAMIIISSVGIRYSTVCEVTGFYLHRGNIL